MWACWHCKSLFKFQITKVDTLCRGLALESMLSLLGLTRLPFFLVLWIMCTFILSGPIQFANPAILANVSVVVFPIEVLPNIYRYGYGAPCYAISKIARTVIFGTKNQGNVVTPVQNKLILNPRACSWLLFRYLDYLGCHFVPHAATFPILVEKTRCCSC
jgi:hypothetical protein